MRWFRFLASLALVWVSFQSIALPIHSIRHFVEKIQAEQQARDDSQGGVVSSDCGICFSAHMTTVVAPVIVSLSAGTPMARLPDSRELISTTSNSYLLPSVRAPPFSSFLT